MKVPPSPGGRDGRDDKGPPRPSVLFVILVFRSASISSAVLFLVKLPLPRRLFLSGFSQEGRKCPDAQKSLVQPVPRLPERAREIHEQYHAIAIRVVPDFVVERVVKDERFALRPVAKLVADADADALARLRHEQG